MNCVLASRRRDLAAKLFADQHASRTLACLQAVESSRDSFVRHRSSESLEGEIA
jgi:hypothetical protein